MSKQWQITVRSFSWQLVKLWSWFELLNSYRWVLGWAINQTTVGHLVGRGGIRVRRGKGGPGGWISLVAPGPKAAILLVATNTCCTNTCYFLYMFTVQTPVQAELRKFWNILDGWETFWTNFYAILVHIQVCYKSRTFHDQQWAKNCLKLPNML